MSSLPSSNYLVSPTVSRRRGSSHKRSMSADFDAIGLGIGLGFGNSPRSQQQQQSQQSPQTPPRPPPTLFSMQDDLDKDFSFPNFKDPTNTPPPPPPFKFNQFHRPSKSLNSPIRFQRTDSSIKEIDEENVDDDEDVDDDVDLVDDDASSYSFFATPRSAANANRYHRIISNVNGVERAVTPPTALTTPEIVVTNDGGVNNKDLYMVASSDSSLPERNKPGIVTNKMSSSSLSREIPLSPTNTQPNSSDSPTPIPIIRSGDAPKLSNNDIPVLNAAPLRSSTSTPPLKSTTDLPSPRRPESPAERKILKDTKIPAFKNAKSLTQPSSLSSLSTARTAATSSTGTQSINTATTASPYYLSRHEFKHRGFLQRRGSNSTDTSSISSIKSKLKRSSRIFDWLRKK